MANAKKEAGEALDELKDYLSRDRKAKDLLGKIERYLGELRRTNSQQKDELQLSKDVNESLRKKSLQDAVDMAEMWKGLEQAQATARQMSSQMASVRKEVEELNEKLDPPSSGESEIDNIAWWPLFRRLRKVLPKAPPPVGVMRHDGFMCYLFDLRALAVQCKVSFEFYQTIGLLTLVAQEFDIAPCFVRRTIDGLKYGFNSKVHDKRHMAAFAQWGGNWFGMSEFDRRVMGGDPSNFCVPPDAVRVSSMTREHISTANLAYPNTLDESDDDG